MYLCLMSIATMNNELTMYNNNKEHNILIDFLFDLSY